MVLCKQLVVDLSEVKKVFGVLIQLKPFSVLRHAQSEGLQQASAWCGSPGGIQPQFVGFCSVNCTERINNLDYFVCATFCNEKCLDSLASIS